MFVGSGLGSCLLWWWNQRWWHSIKATGWDKVIQNDYLYLLCVVAFLFEFKMFFQNCWWWYNKLHYTYEFFYSCILSRTADSTKYVRLVKIYSCTELDYLCNKLFLIRWKERMSFPPFIRFTPRWRSFSCSVVDPCNIVLYLHSPNPYLHSMSCTLCSKYIYISQGRVKDIQEEAMYVYCNEVMKTVKELINTIRESPKRHGLTLSISLQVRTICAHFAPPAGRCEWAVWVSYCIDYESLASYFHDFYISNLVTEMELS